MSKIKNASLMTRDEIMEYYKNYVCFELTEDMIPEEGGLIVGNIDLPVTTVCSLNCKNCCSLIPFYSEKNHFDIEKVLSGLERFLECIDLVVRVNVLGGEPMLYPDLDRVIYALNMSPKVYHVVLTTNGTVIPKNPKLYEELRNEKNEVRISAYDKYSFFAEELVETLKIEEINYTIKRFGKNDFQWFDFGDFNPKNRNEQELVEQYSKCDVEWHPLFEGKLFSCPRAAHAVDMGVIPCVQEDYIDFMDSNISIEQKQQELFRFLHKSYFEACKYCNRGTEMCEEVAVAEQLEG